MPAPACTLGREGEILLLWKSWGGPHQRCKKRGAGFPLRQRWSCCCPGRGWEQPRPPLSRQDGATPAGCCLHCWAHRRGSLSSSALVWCLEPGPVSALLNRDLGLANAPRCASVSPGLRGGSHMPSPPQRQMLCACAAPACACPHLPSPLLGGWGSFEPPQPLLAEAGGGGVLHHSSFQRWVPHRRLGGHRGLPFLWLSPSRPGAEELQAGEAGVVQGGRPVPLHGTGSPGTPPHPARGREQWGWERGSTPGRGGTGDFCTFECLTLFFSVR